MRAILTWHSIDPSESPISVAEPAFRAQLAWLSASGVRVVGLPELLALDDTVDAAALTFDDGFRNFATHAWPLLQAQGFPATLLVVSDHVGRDNRWRGREDAGIPVLPLLDWTELRALQDQGLVIGGHTRTHPNLRALDAAAVREELTGCAATIERHLGARPAGFAYPYGALGAREVSCAAESFQWACTTEYRALDERDDALRLPRLDAWYLTEPATLPRWGSSRFRGSVWLRRQARRLRSAVRPAPGLPA